MQGKNRWRMGVHCSSTALMNFFHYYDVDLEEEVIFGLGRGYGFTFFHYADMEYPYISGRASYLIEKNLTTMGVDFIFRTGEYNEQLKRMEYCLRKGPVIVLVDMNRLNYVRKRLKMEKEVFSPFGEHHFLIVEFEDNEKEKFIKVVDHLWIGERLNIENFKECWENFEMRPFALYNGFYACKPESLRVWKETKWWRKVLSSSILYNFHEYIYTSNPLNKYLHP